VRFETVLTTLISLLIGFFLLFLGISCLTAPSYPEVTKQLLHDILLSPKSAYTVSAILIGFALILFALCASISKRKYSLIKMGGYSLSAYVMQQIAQKTLQMFFNDEDVHCVIEVNLFGKVEMIAALPYVEEELREEKLEQLEDALVAAFSSQCGFTNHFTLNATFKNA
jgi:uncharacterized membrane protein